MWSLIIFLKQCAVLQKNWGREESVLEQSIRKWLKVWKGEYVQREGRGGSGWENTEENSIRWGDCSIKSTALAVEVPAKTGSCPRFYMLTSPSILSVHTNTDRICKNFVVETWEGYYNKKDTTQMICTTMQWFILPNGDRVTQWGFGDTTGEDFNAYCLYVPILLFGERDGEIENASPWL